MSTRSLNKVMLIGNLTRSVDMRYTSSGTPVASFGIATNRSYVDSQGKAVETAEFTNIVAWSKLAEICSNLLQKGMKVYIEGRLQTSSWDDQDTGKKNYRTEVVATEMIILSSNNGKAGDDMGDFDAAGESQLPDEAVDFSKLDTSSTDEDSEKKKEDKKTNATKKDKKEDGKEAEEGEETPF